MCASLPHDVPQCSEADMEFHTALLVASHNHVLMQLASVIRASMRAFFELTTHLGSRHEQALHLHGAIVEAVRLRQPDAAKAAIARILETAVSDLHGGDGRLYDLAERETDKIRSDCFQ
jgi:DNA-binding FadR family transcriptional regulator